MPRQQYFYVPTPARAGRAAALHAGEATGQGLREPPLENARSIRARFDLTPNASLLGSPDFAQLGADA